MSDRRDGRNTCQETATARVLCAVLGLLLCLSFASESRAASSPSFAGPEGAGLVSLNARDVPVADAYAMLAKAAGVRLRLKRGVTDDRRISFSIISEPFWVALERVNQKAGMHVGKVVQDDGPEVTLLPASITSDMRTITSAVDGPFLGALTERAVARGNDKSPAAAVDHLMWLEVQPDPRLKAMMFKDFKIDELIDESGRAISAGASTKAFAFQDGRVSLGIRMQNPPRLIGRMKLSGQAMVATRWDTIEVNNLGSDEPSTTSAPGFRIVSRARPRGNVRHVTLELTRTGQSGPLWLKEPTRIVLLKPVIFDRRNRPLQTNLYDTDWFGKMFRIELDAASPSYEPTAPKPSDADRLRLELPTDVKFYDLHWEFTNVTLN
jgi:hypothetical protein